MEVTARHLDPLRSPRNVSEPPADRRFVAGGKAKTQTREDPKASKASGLTTGRYERSLSCRISAPNSQSQLSTQKAACYQLSYRCGCRYPSSRRSSCLEAEASKRSWGIWHTLLSSVRWQSNPGSATPRQGVRKEGCSVGTVDSRNLEISKLLVKSVGRAPVLETSRIVQ